MKDDKVNDFDRIHIVSTVFRPDTTFCFAYIAFC